MTAIGAGPCLPSGLRGVLVCPLCKGDLDLGIGEIRCARGHLRIPQTRSDCVDLLPADLATRTAGPWSDRQVAMAQWYRDLLETPGDAAACFDKDYRAYAQLLGGLTGRVLDVGGGNGIVRHYLREQVEYILLEPELSWLDVRWSAIVDRFPCLATPPCFVRGIGEYMPFAGASFDAVLAFWSLNHAIDPRAVISEAARVVRPGGMLLLVLEDMPPRWGDLAIAALRRKRPLRTARLVGHKLRAALLGRPWPLQLDHVRLSEGELRAWTRRRFTITQRGWDDTYLTLVLERLPGTLDRGRPGRSGRREPSAPAAALVS